MDYVAVKINVVRAKKNVTQKRTRQNKITLLCAIESQPIRLKYGVFYWVEKDFFVEFFSVLLLRCFDAIIIFDY